VTRRSPYSVLAAVRTVRERMLRAAMADEIREWQNATAQMRSRRRELEGADWPEDLSPETFRAITSRRQALATDLTWLAARVEERAEAVATATAQWQSAEADREGAEHLVKQERAEKLAERDRRERVELDEAGARVSFRLGQLKPLNHSPLADAQAPEASTADSTVDAGVCENDSPAGGSA